jgi:myo-inositol-1(or 4)-monophosphatase
VDGSRLLDACAAAARAAGAEAKARFGRAHDIAFKGSINLVTEADLAAEKAALASLRAAYPEAAVLAEESGAAGAAGDLRFIVDPLDGTTNYAHGLPHFSTTVAAEVRGELAAGVVYDPLRDEIFEAVRGGGARLNGRALRVSGEEHLERALLTTGFPYDLRERPEVLLREFNAFCLAARAVRRLGSAALDLAYVAAGRFDGFFERGLMPWDVAAGELLVREAGGRVTDYRGGAPRLDGGEIVASNGPIHGEMLAVLAKGES